MTTTTNQERDEAMRETTQTKAELRAERDHWKRLAAKWTPEQERLMRDLAQHVIIVAERHPDLRGAPWLHDEADEQKLQERAEQARRFLQSPTNQEHGEG
jgi:hypothetical protein